MLSIKVFELAVIRVGSVKCQHNRMYFYLYYYEEGLY